MSGNSDWKVKYEIDGTEYEAIIQDGSDPIEAEVSYQGYDQEAFKQYIKDNHFGVKFDDVEIVSAIHLDHPLANFF